MAGTRDGGKQAAVSNKKRYGDDFYQIIGAAGGHKSRNGGFASDKVGSDGLTGRERAKLAGSIGGKTSSRRSKDYV